MKKGGGGVRTHNKEKQRKRERAKHFHLISTKEGIYRKLSQTQAQECELRKP